MRNGQTLTQVSGHGRLALQHLRDNFPSVRRQFIERDGRHDFLDGLGEVGGLDVEHDATGRDGIGQRDGFAGAVGVGFIADFADQFLQDVFERDDAGPCAGGVCDESHVLVAALEFGQRVIEGHVFPQLHRRPHDLAQLRGAKFRPALAQGQVFEQNDP